MLAFEIVVNRTFSVMIEAVNRETACRASEFYLGYSDDSKEHNAHPGEFSIHRIEMIENNAVASRPLDPETEEYEELFME
jgi:hypothetical protein